jgi:hypothetical protein
MKKFLIVSLSGLMLLGTSSAAFARHYHRYYNNVPVGYSAAPVYGNYGNYGNVYNNGYGYRAPGYTRHHHRWF